MHDVYCEAQPILCVLHVINNYSSCLSVVQMHAYIHNMKLYMYILLYRQVHMYNTDVYPLHRYLYKITITIIHLCTHVHKFYTHMHNYYWGKPERSPHKR